MDEVQPGDELVAAFVQWAASDRAATAAENRARERWLRDEASSSANWRGILVDLAEHATTVVVASGGHKCSGRVVCVARDFCVLQQPDGRPALLPLAAMSALWPEPAAGGTSVGDRAPDLALSFVGALAALAEDRIPVALTLDDGVGLVGRVVSVGDDVITLRTEGTHRRFAHVRLACVTCCEVR
jgi:hypothetical protein